MNPFPRRIPRVRASRRRQRTTALAFTVLISGAALLLAGCSEAGPASSAGPSGPSGSAGVNGGSAHGAGAAPAAAQPAAGALAPAAAGSGSQPAAQLALSSPSIIFTASLTVQARNVAAEAARAISIAEDKGGYVSSEQASIHPAGHARPRVSLQLKIPVAGYQPALSQLSTTLGTQLSLSQQAQDVTGQVADVSSRVASAQAAITQLQALLARAGSISDLLSVQDEINSQESSLEELQAQQRALDGETSYATVSLTLESPVPVTHAARPATTQRHGFVAGLAAGWRGLRVAVSAVLTAVGAALPFAAVAAVLAGAGYVTLRRRRRRSRATAAG
jgi:hypothetical protein